VATDAKRFAIGFLPSTLGYIDADAVPSGKLRFIKAVTFCNIDTAAKKVSLVVYSGSTDYYLVKDYLIPAIGGENTITIPFMDQVLIAGDRIKGYCETASKVYAMISGKEVTI